MALGMGEKNKNYDEKIKEYTQEELKLFRIEEERKKQEKREAKEKFESQFSKRELQIISENRNEIRSYQECMAEMDVYFDTFADACKEWLKGCEEEEKKENKEESKMELVNLTPHPIMVEGFGTFESKGLARVSTTQKVVGNINGIDLVETVQGQVEGLPEMEEGKMYIVSGMVLSALKGSRADVVAPDTGSTAIRNEKGQIIAVTRFTR